MKKVFLRILSFILISTMIFMSSAGCSERTGDEYDFSDFIYIPEFITLPVVVQNIRGIAYSEDVIYIASNERLDEDRFIYTSKIYSMNLDGSDFMELAEYSPKLPDEVNTAGSIEIDTFNMDPEGYIWVCETGRFDSEETGDFITTTVLRKLSITGAEIQSVDLDILFNSINPHAWFYIIAITVDGAGNIILEVAVSGVRVIYVLNDDGTLQFELDTPNWETQIFKMPDGTAALFTYGEGLSRRLQKVDYSAEAWGEIIELPIYAYYIHSGGNSFDLILRDSNNLFGVKLDSFEVVKLLNWVDSDVMTDDLDNILVLQDDRIICTNQTIDFATWEATYELIILTKKLHKDVPERTVLTLAAFALDWRLKNAVIQFNRTNPVYRIQVIDYLDQRTDEDWFAGLTMLSLEIISGKVPDMFAVSSLPFSQYLARGLIEDLYPFIDNDPVFNRSDFIKGALKASEHDGKLYQIFPDFSINTIIGHPSVVGPDMGWTVDEFLAVLEANPQADIPMGEWLTKEFFLMSTVLQSINEYVNWSSGTVTFDSGAFAGILELADTFPAEIDWGTGHHLDMPSPDIPIEELIATGRQILAGSYLGDFSSVKNYRDMFGGEITFKGLPTENKNGNTMSVSLGLAMTTECNDKTGAWEFLRVILTREWQLSNIFDFPVNKEAFYIKAEKAMVIEETPDWWSSEWGVFPGLFPLTQKELDQTIALINSLSGIVYLNDDLMNIIREVASDFFNGRYSTAQEAARIIQSRAAILVAEQMG